MEDKGERKEKGAELLDSENRRGEKRFSVSNRFLHTLMSVVTVITGIGMTVGAIFGIYNGIFSSQDRIVEIIKEFGVWGPAIFLVIQIIQIVIPVIPGGFTCVAGVFAFGPRMGFVYNYISIVLGSLIVFLLSRRFGLPLIQKIFAAKKYERYEEWLQRGRKFEILFAVAIFLPVAPDDFLCYLAGLTKMSFRKFACIIILCKPLSIFMYSMGVSKVLEYLTRFFSRT